MFDLESLGITQEELQERVIDRICDQLMRYESYGEDEGRCYVNKSELVKQMEALIKERIDTSIKELAEKHVLPSIVDHIENLCLQETNQWGEAVGDPMTFIEYLVRKADAYINEKVNHEGKAEREDSYNWRGKQTRIAYMIHRHLHDSVEAAMKSAITDANKILVKSIEDTAKIKLEEISKTLKVSVQS